jgi:hypothetical protein
VPETVTASENVICNEMLDPIPRVPFAVDELTLEIVAGNVS